MAYYIASLYLKVTNMKDHQKEERGHRMKLLLDIALVLLESLLKGAVK